MKKDKQLSTIAVMSAIDSLTHSSGVVSGEMVIAKYAGVSRQFVREVMIKLECRGFVQRSHGCVTRIIKDPLQCEEHF